MTDTEQRIDEIYARLGEIETELEMDWSEELLQEIDELERELCELENE